MEYQANQVYLSTRKPIGAYLVEAGLLSDAQVGVALADQTTTALPFGEIVVTRGWVKEKTIEYLMQKVIIPERNAQKETCSDLEAGLVRQNISRVPVRREYNRVPAKASTPVRSSSVLGPKTTTPPAPTADDEEGVSWIG
jgi:hypothetical protein